MRLRRPHAPYIANKIAIDLANSNVAKIETTLDNIKDIAQKVILQDILREESLEERARELLEENEEEIEFMRLNEKELFWMIKKKLADEYKVILNLEDRYNDLSHRVMNELVLEGALSFEVSDNMVKNIIFKAIYGYVKSFEDIEEVVLARIDGYKRRLIPGTEEYEIVFQKLYEEELKKRSLL